MSWQDPETSQTVGETMRKRLDSVSQITICTRAPMEDANVEERKDQAETKSCFNHCAQYWWEISVLISFMGVLILLFMAMSYYDYVLRLSFGSAEDITKQRDFQIVVGISGIIFDGFVVQLAFYVGWRVIRIANKRDEMEEAPIKSMKSMYMKKCLLHKIIFLCLMIALLINSTILCIVVFSYECGYASTYNVAYTSALLYKEKLVLQIGSDPTAVEQTSGPTVPLLKQQTNKIVADLMKEAPNGYSFSWHECQCFDAVAAKFSRDACTETTCVLASDTITIECIAPSSCELYMAIAVGGIANGVNEHYTEPINITLRVVLGKMTETAVADFLPNPKAVASKKSTHGPLFQIMADFWPVKPLFFSLTYPGYIAVFVCSVCICVFACYLEHGLLRINVDCR